MQAKLVKETIERTLNDVQEEIDSTVSIEYNVLDENENQVEFSIMELQVKKSLN